MGTSHHGIYWSPLALLLIALLALAMLIALLSLYAFPVSSQMPVMAGSARIVLDGCCRLEAPLPKKGIKWGDISTPRKRIAGFGEDVGELK